jgi:hypothetical protein
MMLDRSPFNYSSLREIAQPGREDMAGLCG